MPEEIARCSICGNNYWGSECPNCGCQSPDPPPPPPPPGAPANPLAGLAQVTYIDMSDPVAVFLWELLRKVPNGELSDALTRVATVMKLGDGCFRLTDRSVFPLAVHCQSMADKIHGLRRKTT